jgi:hypothetical protein
MVLTGSEGPSGVNRPEAVNAYPAFISGTSVYVNGTRRANHSLVIPRLTGG